VASALIGTIVGSIAVGRTRRRGSGGGGSLLIRSSFAGVGQSAAHLAWTWWFVHAFRFLGVLAGGRSVGGFAMYIAEISPARYRGRLAGRKTQFNIGLGILLAYLSTTSSGA